MEPLATTTIGRSRLRPHALIGLGFIGLATAYAAITVLTTRYDGARFALTGLYLGTAYACVAVLFRTVGYVTGPQRRNWLYLSVGLAALAAGDTIWSAHQLAVDPAGPTLGSTAGVVYGIAYIPLLLFVGGVLWRTIATMPGLARVRLLLEIATATAVMSAVAIMFVVVPEHTDAAVPASHFALAAIFSVLDVFIVMSLSAIALESPRAIWWSWEGKIVISLIVTACVQLVSSRLEMSGAYRLGTPVGSIVDMMWLAAYAIAAMAASQRMEARPDQQTGLAVPLIYRRGLRWYDFAIPFAMLALAPISLWQAREAQLDDTTFWVLASSTVLVMAFVLFRSVLLTAENGALMAHSVVDPLTGVYNHRYFHERLSIELDRARRSGERLTIALIDVDDFGSVNAEHGHSFGDRALRAVTRTLRRQEGSAETLCRMGSDEFGLIMPLTGPHEAAERMAVVLERLRADREVGNVLKGASIGIASFPNHASDAAELFEKADGALYWAQSNGGRSVIIYDEGVVKAFSPEERLRISEEQSYMQTVESLAAAVDARDPYTQHHSRNVSDHAGRLARALGFSENHAALIGIAGLLHDVGKIGVPDHVLRKAGPLTEDERLAIQTHPVLGERILGATIFKEILPWVLCHHERPDGTGYPNGIADEEIPVEARILAVCDAYDAMVSDRPYRAGLERSEAFRRLREGAGTQFDPDVVTAFTAMLKPDTVEPQVEAVSPKKLETVSPN